MNLQIHILLDTPTSLDQLVIICDGPSCNKHIFTTVSSEVYTHNAVSERLLDKSMASSVGVVVDDGLLAGAHMSNCLANHKFQIPDNQRETGFSTAFQTTHTFYEYLHCVDEQRGARFDAAMECNAQPFSEESTFPFENLKENAILVDVGGGRGHISHYLMRRHPHIQFIVQDDAAVIESVKADLEGNRFKFQTQNFFDLQPVVGADVYLLNNVLMDHQDETCTEASQAQRQQWLVQALEKRSYRAQQRYQPWKGWELDPVAGAAPKQLSRRYYLLKVGHAAIPAYLSRKGSETHLDVKAARSHREQQAIYWWNADNDATIDGP
ncbi:hypothetical protein ETB97_004927 [Aspergillus alliaceus]|uniref:O-methyltransferase C-terminal domain-containing protein n=1 Tax=Petromyces alliaceus TaxID=209559 RepID=A0A8H6A296_PETAA|nr:hypothetical protein ETB97_004927 [Aspergillus burnettii]